MLGTSAALALGLAGLPQVLKGYGDTQARGRLNYARLWGTHVVPALTGDVDAEQAAAALREALTHTLADPEGKINAAHRLPAGAQPIFWAAKPGKEAPTSTAA